MMYNPVDAGLGLLETGLGFVDEADLAVGLGGCLEEPGDQTAGLFQGEGVLSAHLGAHFPIITCRDKEIAVSNTVARLEVVICQGPTCSLMNGEELHAWCADLGAAGLPIAHEVSGCTGNCLEAPVVEWNGRIITEASPALLTETLIDEGLL